MGEPIGQAPRPATTPVAIKTLLTMADQDKNKKVEGKELTSLANNIASANGIKTMFIDSDADNGFFRTQAENFIKQQLNITTATNTLIHGSDQDNNNKIEGKELTKLANDIASSNGIKTMFVDSDADNGFFRTQAEKFIKQELDIEEIKTNREMVIDLSELSKELGQLEKAEKTLLTNIKRGKATSEDFEKAGLGNLSRDVVGDIMAKNIAEKSITIDSIKKDIIKFSAKEKILKDPLQSTVEDYKVYGLNEVTAKNLNKVNAAVNDFNLGREFIGFDDLIQRALKE
jgi:hypothetical protein